MAHNWGLTVPPDLPIKSVLEIGDKLRAGTMEIALPDAVLDHENATQWHEELNSQMLAAYEAEAERRLAEPCPYCPDGSRTGLPGNACENCMNTGLKYPEYSPEFARN